MKKTIANLFGPKGGVNPTRVADLRTLIIPTYTSTQKQALAVAEGTVVYDSTLNKLCVYTAEAGGTSTGWETITSILE